MQQAFPPYEGEDDWDLLCLFCSFFGAFTPGKGRGSQPKSVYFGNSSFGDGLEKEMETVGR